MNNEQSLFLSNNIKIELSNGKEVVLPKMNLKTTIQTTKLIKDLVGNLKTEFPDMFSSLIDMEKGEIKLDGIVNSLPTLIPTLIPLCLDSLISLCSTYIDVSETEILDEWTTEDLIKVLNPFFGHILQQINQLLALTQNLNPEPQKTVTQKIVPLRK